MNLQKANLFDRTGHQNIYTACHNAEQDRFKIYIHRPQKGVIMRNHTEKEV